MIFSYIIEVPSVHFFGEDQGIVIESGIEKNVDEVAINMGEATSNGNALKGEYLGINNEEQQSVLSRFELFKSMIAEIARQCDFEYQEYLHQLPKVGRSRLHRMTDGRARYIMEVQFQLNGTFYSILELDTDDNGKAISTLVVNKSNPKEWDDNLQEVTKKVVSGSLNWPRKSIDEVGRPYYLNHSIDYQAYLQRIINAIVERG